MRIAAALVRHTHPHLSASAWILMYGTRHSEVFQGIRVSLAGTYVTRPVKARVWSTMVEIPLPSEESQNYFPQCKIAFAFEAKGKGTPDETVDQASPKVVQKQR
eukprot:2669191-Amphidinium_carterae.1